MAIASSHNKHVYTGNGATTRWPYTFTIHDVTDILVYVTDPQGRINQVTNNFSVDTGAGEVLYPISGAPLASEWNITLLRSTALTQELDLVNQGAFYAEDVEKALDKLTMIAQAQEEKIARSIQLPVDQTGGGDEIVGQILTAVANAEDSATSATQSAAGALASQTAAATSASEALSSKNAASASASAAAASETTAVSSATAAANSATAAAGSASAAATSATNAANNANASSTSANTASVKAAEAASSATEAADSAYSAASSAAAAAASAASIDPTFKSGQYLGNAATKAISYNSQVIDEDITIPAAINAYSAGPITIATGRTVTISDGSYWTVF